MAPKGSSASKGTKKKVEAKRAAKAATQQENGETPSGPPAKGNKARGKKNKKEPRQKQYVPPPKPPRGAVDPIDMYGLASALDAQLVVTLRKFMKKDDKTVGRALDELSAWLSMQDTDAITILMCLPVWLHHFARLAQHPDKRIRQSTGSVQMQLLDASDEIREALVVADAAFLANWIMLAFDADRSVRLVASRSWNSANNASAASQIDLNEQAPMIIQHLLAHVEFNPDSAADSGQASEDEKSRLQMASSTAESSQVEDALSRQTRSLVGSLDAIAWILQNVPTSTEINEILLYCSAWDMLRSHSDALPPARKSAWNLLSAILKQDVQFSEDQLSSISQALFAAFEEDDAGVQSVMWNGLLLLLQRYPQTWKIANGTAEEQNNSDSEEVDAEGQNTPTEATPNPAVVQALLEFISQRCAIQPAQNYPGLILLLASIPASFYSFIEPKHASQLFDVFWSCPDCTQPMFDSALECMLFVVKRTSEQEEGASLASRQIKTAWKAVITQAAANHRLQMRSFISALEKLQSYNPGYLESSWHAVLEETSAAFDIQQHVAAGQAIAALGRDMPEHSVVVQNLVDLVEVFFQKAYDALKATSNHSVMANMLSAFHVVWRSCSKYSSEKSLRLCDDVASGVVPRLIIDAPELAPGAADFLQSYILCRNDLNPISQAWTSVFHLLPAADPLVSRSLLERFIKLSQENKLPSSLENAHLDHMLRDKVNETILSPSAKPVEATDIALISGILHEQTPFVEAGLPQEILNLVLYQSSDQIDSILTNGSQINAALRNQMSLLADFVQRPSAVARLFDLQLLARLLALAFKAAYLLPDSEGALRSCSEAAWSTIKVSPQQIREEVTLSLVDTCRKLLADPNAITSPAEILLAYQKLSIGTLTEILPSFQSLHDQKIVALSDFTPPAALAIWSPSLDISLCSSSHGYDTCTSPTSYIRSMTAVIQIAMSDRKTVLARPDLLIDFVLLRQIARVALLEAGSASSILGTQVSHQELKALHDSCDALFTYTLGQLATDATKQWHDNASAVLSGNSSKVQDPILEQLQRLLSQCRELQRHSACLLVQTACQLLRALIERSEEPASCAECWLPFARRMQSNNPDLASGIYEVITPFLEESPVLQRVRLQLASDLSGVKAVDANIKGEPLLRLLMAVAPSQSSTVEILPQQRAVFLVKSLQTWLLDEVADDLNDAILGQLVRLLTALAPTLQGVQGSHWDFSLDITETVLEGADWSLPLTLPSLWSACRWMRVVDGLLDRNTMLRQTCSDRFAILQTALFKLILDGDSRRYSSFASEMIVEEMGILLKDFKPPYTASDPAMTKLVHLFNDSEHQMRMLAYSLAKSIGESEIRQLIVEMELATEELPEAKLPEGLFAALGNVDENQLGSFLLSWQLALSFIDAASAAVRSSFLEQLRNEGLVTGVLIPTLINHMGFAGRSSPSDIQYWVFDEPDLQDMEDTPLSVTLHSAHIFYRVLELLPSLARAWVEGTKDRQLSSAFVNFTSRYFSPLLINKELRPLRDQQNTVKKPDPLDEDPLSIKVASTVNEVKAVYSIDDQALELTVRLPSDYPLSPVDIRDSKRVGVSENTWRAWMLAVQQVISTGNARIADALELFKRNITLHFEGVEACAICYSVISLADRRLPTKKCRTCKNIFHASCLFKWFSTSHGSSCPLCRSLF